MGTPYPDKKAKLKFMDEHRPKMQMKYSFLPKRQVEGKLLEEWFKFSQREGYTSNNQVGKVNKPDKRRDGHQRTKNCGSFLGKTFPLKNCLKSASPPSSPPSSSSYSLRSQPLKSVTIPRKPLKEEDNNIRCPPMTSTSFSHRPTLSISRNFEARQSIESRSSSDDILPRIVVSDYSISSQDDPNRPRTTIEVIRYGESIGFFDIDDQGPYIMSHSGERLPAD